MTQLAIIIPAVGETAQWEETLANVLQHRPTDSEVILVTSGPYADPYDLADEIGIHMTDPGTSLIGCLNAGVSISETEVVHVVLPGVQVESEWTEPAMLAFADRSVGSVAPVAFDKANPNRLWALGVRYGSGGTRHLSGRGKGFRTRMIRRAGVQGATLSAGFYRRESLLAVGGWSESVGPRLADIDLGMRLKGQGLQVVIAPESQVTVAEDVVETESSWRRGRECETLYLRWKDQSGALLRMVTHGAHLMGRATKALTQPRLCVELLSRLVTRMTFQQDSSNGDLIVQEELLERMRSEQEGSDASSDENPDVLTMTQAEERDSAHGESIRRAA